MSSKRWWIGAALAFAIAWGTQAQAGTSKAPAASAEPDATEAMYEYLLAEFSANMAKKVAEQSLSVPPVEAHPLAAAAPAAAPSPPPAAAEISGFSLLWRAFLSWLRGKR